jgi:hypothetical protein
MGDVGDGPAAGACVRTPDRVPPCRPRGLGAWSRLHGCGQEATPLSAQDPAA